MVSATAPDPLALALRPPSAAVSLGGGGGAAGDAGDVWFPKLEDYVRGLEEERRKVEAFRRELPLCMLILTRAIEELKRKLDEQGEAKQRNECASTKVNWISSAQLLFSGNHRDVAADGDDQGKTAGQMIGTGARVKFRAPHPPSQQVPAKARRCWSKELHRRFVSAVEQLGGSQAATPKQIRELMKEEGLTNDEVKSHLQKFRQHAQRSPASSSSPADRTAVVLGGLRVSEEHCAVAKQSTSQSASNHRRQ